MALLNKMLTTIVRPCPSPTTIRSEANESRWLLSLSLPPFAVVEHLRCFKLRMCSGDTFILFRISFTTEVWALNVDIPSQPNRVVVHAIKLPRLSPATTTIKLFCSKQSTHVTIGRDRTRPEVVRKANCTRVGWYTEEMEMEASKLPAAKRLPVLFRLSPTKTGAKPMILSSWACDATGLDRYGTAGMESGDGP